MSLPPFSSSSSKKDYGVFLSFRGKDTRKNFTDHFYYNLVDSGIVTFRDKERLKTGKDIASGLFEAIQQSSSAVIILSENYASSAWCLKELAEIVKQEKERGLKVFPIFYHVDPSVFRRQTEKVGEAIVKHEKRYDEETIQKWRDALTQVANMSGWDFSDQYESEFIRDKVKRISAELCQTYPFIHDGLVGIGSRLEELKSKLQIGEDDVRIIGICGMGGIGKTTLAIVVYNQMSPHFQGKCFIANVREVWDRCVLSGLVSLQKQLLSQILNEGFNLFNDHEGKAIISHRLSHKKVLVVLDDVDKLQQLECLVGRRDWFGSGSRIIVTTRDESLLRSHRVDDVYKVEILDYDDALRLFLSKAFGNDAVPNDLMELSRRVVRYARGLPLALEVLGKYFGGIDAAVAIWRSAIERLERESHKEIIDILRIGFDGLEESQKNIFLDLACFFDPEDDTDFVIDILDGCGFYPRDGIDVLVKKSLVTLDEIEDEEGLTIWGMHDLLREMAIKIVQEKSKEPGKRCRLWDITDVHHVLTADTATDEIECISILRDWESYELLDLSVDAFSKMKKLRLLRILCLTSCDYLNYLSNELRLLHWNDCPLRSFPPSFQPHNLVALFLFNSRIEQLWQGTVHMEKLKNIYLSRSKNLIKTPDFTEAPNLEVLDLRDCTSLIEVHPSIAVHKRVKILDLRACTSLSSLPPKIRMDSLEKLTLSGCTKLERFPEIDGKMERLWKLNLSGCYKIVNLREMLGQLQLLSSLKELNLRDCNLGDGDIATEIGCLPSLEILDLSGNHFISLMPLSFDRFPKLRYLDLSNCKELKSLPGLLTTIESVRTDGCVSLELIEIPSKECNSDRWARFCGTNCFRLAEKMNAVTFLKKHVKLLANPGAEFDMIIPGSEIPKWFSHQIFGHSFAISLPLNTRNDSQWMGVAFCCIFVSTDASSSTWKGDYESLCTEVSHNYASGRLVGGYRPHRFCKENGQLITDDHMLLRYWSRDKLYELSFKKLKFELFELEDSSLPNEGNDHFMVTFQHDGLSNSVKVKQCGFRLVYQKDLEDNQLIEEQQYNNEGSAEFEDNSEDGSIANGSLVKQNEGINLELSLRSEWSGNSVNEVKQIGDRTVCQKDWEGIQLIEEQRLYNNQGSAEFEDNIEDGSVSNGSLVKRKRNVSEDDTEAISQQPKFSKFI